MRTGFLCVLSGAALLMGLAGDAHAQALCQLSNGQATIANGSITTDPGGSGRFVFTGVLGGSAGTCNGLKLCARGNLSNAACPFNQHAGDNIIFQGNCNVRCGTVVTNGQITGSVPCTSSNLRGSLPSGFPQFYNAANHQTLTASSAGVVGGGSYSGVCVGANCSGGGTGPGQGYTLNFNQATIDAAMEKCNPTGPDPNGITSAGFDGAHGRQ